MADITNDIAALRAALPGLKGWGLERVEPCHEDYGQAEVGTSFDDGGFAPVITVDTGLYYANDRAMPLARAVSVACVAAPALLAELDRLTAALQAAQAEAAALSDRLGPTPPPQCPGNHPIAKSRGTAAAPPA